MTLSNLVALVVGIFIGLLIIGLIIKVISLRRVVPTNMVHIVQSRNATVPYGKGKDAGNVYYAWPAWLPMIGVVVSKFPESVFDISLINYEAYDKGRLQFMVDIKAFFRIQDASVAAQRVSSFDELQDQLKAVVQGAVRRVLGTNGLEEIMADRSKLGTEFTTEVDEQLKEWGVSTVKSIEFMDIRDAAESNTIRSIMAKEKSRIDMESRTVVAKNKQQAETREIEAVRTVEITKQEADQQIGIRAAEKDKAVGIAREQSKQEVQQHAKVTAERNAEVAMTEQVNAAKISREVSVVRADEQQQIQTIAADTQKKVQITKANGDKDSLKIEAEGKLFASQQDATGIEAIGRATAEAEKAKLMAPVDAQIALAKEIGSNEGYQNYLIKVETVKSSVTVGVAMAEAMSKADLKIIANSGDVQSGIGKLADVFTPAGGTSLSGMLTALAATDEGKALVGRLTGTNQS
ncbi:hypothetical protein [Ralstonia phage RP13]|nr:hypothetical protein [Ralstonia phage RP13]